MNVKNWIRILWPLTIIQSNMNNPRQILLIKTKKNARVASNASRFSIEIIIYLSNNVFRCLMRTCTTVNFQMAFLRFALSAKQDLSENSSGIKAL